VRVLRAFSHGTSVTVAQVAFLFLLIAGVWIAFAWLLLIVASYGGQVFL
jgi:hypothetical protein